MNPLEIAGWITLTALVIVLVAHSRSMRDFTRPRLAIPESWPSLSIAIAARQPDNDVRRLVSEIADAAYPGELEIIVAAESPDHVPAMTTLAVASSRLRVVLAPSDSRGRFVTLAREASGERLLILHPSFHLEPDAIRRLVSEAMSEDTDAALLLPRLDIGWSSSIREAMVPWLRLTAAPVLDRALPDDASYAVLARASVVRGESSSQTIRCFDGYDSACRGALGADGCREAVAEMTGRSGVHRMIAAIALVFLFTFPPAVAVATHVFPWIVAAVVSFWLRFRVAVRTGEPVAMAFLHPLSALVVAIDLLRTGTRGAHATKRRDIT